MNEKDLAQHLIQLSADEMLSALGLRGAPPPLRRLLALPFLALSYPVGATLARFDADIARHGLPTAAARALTAFGVRLAVTSRPPREGPLLVLSNHPGAYDALSLMAGIGRPDLLILAADRTFLRALPSLAHHHLGFLPEGATGRASALKRAFAHLRRGGALLHFPAGSIEPDPAFADRTDAVLGPWMPGTAPLVRALARVQGAWVLAGVEGVHSRRAKELFVSRWAERRGVTTVPVLLQVVARLRDVRPRVRFTPPLPGASLAHLPDDAITPHLRRALLDHIASPAA